MTTTTILSDNGVSSGTAGIKTTGGNDGTLQLQTTTSGGTATTAVTIDTSQNVGIGTSSPTAKVDVSGGGDGLQMRLQRTADAGFVLSETTGNTNWKVKNSGGGIYFQYSATAYDSGYSTKVGIDSSGNLLVGTTSAFAAGKLTVEASNSFYSFASNQTGTGQKYHVVFGSSGTVVGSITSSGSTTSYTTSSDYRLKENIQPMTGALEKITALKPCTYTWKVDGSEGQGFIAHELQAVVPDCVMGEKDAVDADGNPKYQGIDTSFLVATLTAAIQEQQALINNLTERLSALESK